MGLTIKKTKITKPPKICIYGKEGIGKSTFASQAPKPIFIATEDRHEHLGVEAFEFAEGRLYAISYKEVIAALKFLVENTHTYKTVVIDTLDFLQTYLYADICQQYGTKDMQDMKVFPFQRGYEIAGKRWAEEVTPLLQYLNTQKKMWIIGIGHVMLESVNDPDKEAYNVHTLPLHKKHIRPQIVDSADIIGFIDQKVLVTDEGKARGAGELVMKFKKNPTYVSKDSYGLPEIMPFPKGNAWKLFTEALLPLITKGKEDENKSNENSEQTQKGSMGQASEARSVRASPERDKLLRDESNGTTKGTGNLGAAAKAHEEDKKEREEIRRKIENKEIILTK